MYRVIFRKFASSQVIMTYEGDNSYTVNPSYSDIIANPDFFAEKGIHSMIYEIPSKSQIELYSIGYQPHFRIVNPDKEFTLFPDRPINDKDRIYFRKRDWKIEIYDEDSFRGIYESAKYHEEDPDLEMDIQSR